MTTIPEEEEEDDDDVQQNSPTRSKTEANKVLEKYKFLEEDKEKIRKGFDTVGNDKTQESSTSNISQKESEGTQETSRESNYSNWNRDGWSKDGWSKDSWGDSWQKSQSSSNWWDRGEAEQEQEEINTKCLPEAEPKGKTFDTLSGDFCLQSSGEESEDDCSSGFESGADSDTQVVMHSLEASSSVEPPKPVDLAPEPVAATTSEESLFPKTCKWKKGNEAILSNITKTKYSQQDFLVGYVDKNKPLGATNWPGDSAAGSLDSNVFNGKIYAFAAEYKAGYQKQIVDPRCCEQKVIESYTTIKNQKHEAVESDQHDVKETAEAQKESTSNTIVSKQETTSDPLASPLLTLDENGDLPSIFPSNQPHFANLITMPSGFEHLSEPSDDSEFDEVQPQIKIEPEVEYPQITIGGSPSNDEKSTSKNLTDVKTEKIKIDIVDDKEETRKEIIVENTFRDYKPETYENQKPPKKLWNARMCLHSYQLGTPFPVPGTTRDEGRFTICLPLPTDYKRTIKLVLEEGSPFEPEWLAETQKKMKGIHLA